MSVNCNSILQAGAKDLEEKADLGRSASIAIHAALSNCYKAVETLETSRTATGAEVVYFRATANKLEAAAQALRGMLDILAKGSLSDASMAWLKALDYDRLYASGTKRGLIPANAEQWNRLVGMMRSLDRLAVTNRLIADVEDLEKKIHSMIDALLSDSTGGPITTEEAEHLSTIQTALVQFATFTQMVSYLNVVEPRDMAWCRQVSPPDAVMREHDTGVPV